MMRQTRRIVALAIAALGAAGCPGVNPPADPCKGAVCGKNTHCEAQRGVCACDSGYQGDPVTGCTSSPQCAADSCGDHAICDVSSGSIVCGCEAGYAGDGCSECTDGYVAADGACLPLACSEVTCNGHGTCAMVKGTPTCTCETGYALPYCVRCATDFAPEGADDFLTYPSETICFPSQVPPFNINCPSFAMSRAVSAVSGG